MRRISFLVLAGCAVALLACAPRSPVQVVLDGSRRFQTIDGWATVTRYWEEDKANDRYDRSFEPYVDRVARFLADEVGINSIRLELLSGMENPHDYWKQFYNGQIGYREYARHRYEKINDDADPETQNVSGFQFDLVDYRVRTAVLPLKNALEARGERLHLNLCYVDFRSNAAAGRTVQGDLSHADDPREFAELVLVYFRWLREKYRLEPDAFEIVLEPDNTSRWRGEQIGRAIVAVTDKLQANGFTPEILAPSNTSMGNAIRYFDEMIQLPGALDRIDTFVYHRYRRQRTSDVERIAARARERGLKTAMLETIDEGIDTLLEDLTVGQVSGWQLWGPAAKLSQRDTGAVYAMVDTTSAPANPKIVRTRRANELSQVFQHVRRGAVRIESRSTPSRHVSAAFVNPDGLWTVIVRLASATDKVSIEGLPPGDYGMRYLTDGGSHVNPGEATVSPNGTLTMVPPAAGVLTVYGVDRQR